MSNHKMKISTNAIMLGLSLLAASASGAGAQVVSGVLKVTGAEMH